MQLDKETLIKHQFWAALGVLVPLALITMLWLAVWTSEANQGLDKTFKEMKVKLEQLQRNKPKNEADLKNLQGRLAMLDKKKDDFWEQGWKLQKEMMTWPAKVKDQLSELKFGDPIDVKTCAIYAQPNVYPSQLEELGKLFNQIVCPISIVPDEVKATLKAGGLKSSPIKGLEERQRESMKLKDNWRSVLTYVPNWAARSQAPSSEEVWLAQEDLWVQQEILRALGTASDTIAALAPVGAGPKPAAGELFRQSFANADWQIDLAIVSKDTSFILRGRLKNVGRQPQAIGQLFFLVSIYEKGQPIILPVEGDAVPVGKEVVIADYEPQLGRGRPDGIFGVAQLYEWRLAPIRAIQEIKLGACSHRTHESLKSPRFQVKDDDAAAGRIPGGVPAPGEPKGNKTAFGLERDRYCDVTDQVRRLPVGLVLLVDQQHIQEVLTALANCRLRLQITQVTWKHYRGNVGPGEKELEAKGAADPKAKPAEVAPHSNLVELVIYAAATIYERHAGKEAAAETLPAPDPKLKGKDKAKEDAEKAKTGK